MEAIENTLAELSHRRPPAKSSSQVREHDIRSTAGDLPVVLIVDDVMTTGASLNECARTLKLHGAKSVVVLIVARALPKSS